MASAGAPPSRRASPPERRRATRAAPINVQQVEPGGPIRPGCTTPTRPQSAIEHEEGVEAVQVDPGQVLEQGAGADQAHHQAESGGRPPVAPPEQDERGAGGGHRQGGVGLDRDAATEPVGQARQVRRPPQERESAADQGIEAEARYQPTGILGFERRVAFMRAMASDSRSRWSRRNGPCYCGLDVSGRETEVVSVRSRPIIRSDGACVLLW